MQRARFHFVASISHEVLQYALERARIVLSYGIPNSWQPTCCKDPENPEDSEGNNPFRTPSAKRTNPAEAQSTGSKQTDENAIPMEDMTSKQSKQRDSQKDEKMPESPHKKERKRESKSSDSDE